MPMKISVLSKNKEKGGVFDQSAADKTKAGKFFILKGIDVFAPKTAFQFIIDSRV